MKKSSFLTFCFAFIPGAGEMYLGMMKKGIVVMSAFWGLICVAGFMQLEFLFFLLPIIWFYSFFESLNAYHMTDAQRQQIEDRTLCIWDKEIGGKLFNLLQSRHMLIGGGLIFLGAWMILRNFLAPTLSEIFMMLGFNTNILYYLINRIPTFAVSVCIILFGVHLVKGKKKSALPEDDFVEYKGEHHE